MTIPMIVCALWGNDLKSRDLIFVKNVATEM